MKDRYLLQEMTEYVLQAALRKGASHVRVTAVKETSNELTVLNNTLEKIQSSVESVLHIHLFADGRYGTCSTNTTNTDNLNKLLDESIASVKLLEPDPFRQLVPGDLQYKGPSLQDAFSGELPTETKKICYFLVQAQYKIKIRHSSMQRHISVIL